jgi:SAM-dependent methyltransferase
MAEKMNSKINAKEEELRFGFGANWADYVEKNFSDERVNISQRHLLGFLKLGDLRGRTFLDIGCGSGLHSLAALRANAEKVVSFDYDHDSVVTTNRLREMSGSPSNWTVLQGSVLDDAFMATLPKADIVYSWGVLHHTGHMWDAIRNAASAVSADGVYNIALYSKDVYVSPPFEYWLDVKRRYNRSGRVGKAWMEWQYAWKDSIKGCILRGKNPMAHMREYKRSRGMSYWHDVRDWLGGYPMEFAGNNETEVFAREQLGMELIHTKAGEGNTEFLFRRRGALNYWDTVTSSFPLQILAGPFEHVAGFAWRCEIYSPSIGDPRQFMLYENGTPVGWPNAPVEAIRAWGRGRYRVEQNFLIFSSLENADPNKSRATYAFRAGFA